MTVSYITLAFLVPNAPHKILTNTMRFFFHLLVVLLCIIRCQASGKPPDKAACQERHEILIMAIWALKGEPAQKRRKIDRGPRIRRTQRKVSGLMYELGCNAKRYFRMSDRAIWNLHTMLKDGIEKSVKARAKKFQARRRLKRVRLGRRRPYRSSGHAAPNVIDSTIRLCAALRR